MNYIKLLGANVRAYRKRMGLTQEQLADLSDLHRTYIGAIERGDRNVSLNNIVCIANALKVEPYMLLYYEKDNKENEILSEPN